MDTQYTELSAQLQAQQHRCDQLEARCDVLAHQMVVLADHLGLATCALATDGVAICMKESAENIQATRETIKKIAKEEGIHKEEHTHAK